MMSHLLVLVALALAAAVALYVLFGARHLSASRAGRILILIGLCLLPVGAGALGVSHDLGRSTETRFCLSCHEMRPYGQSLLIDDNEPVPAVHYQKRLVDRDTACYTCHRDYALFGDVSTKLSGLRHVWAHFAGGPPAAIKLYRPYPNASCLHCHAGARGYETSKHHATAEVNLLDLQAGKLSCLAKGCHAVTHDIASLADADLWKHVELPK